MAGTAPFVVQPELTAIAIAYMQHPADFILLRCRQSPRHPFARGFLCYLFRLRCPLCAIQPSFT